MDITFSQVLSALLTSFFACAHAPENAPAVNKAFWLQLESVGFLAHFESLLSTIAEDQGILEDFSVAVESLSCVRIQIVKEMPIVKESGKLAMEYPAPVKIDITPDGWLVQVWLGWDFGFDDLPQPFKAKRKPCTVAIVPVLISEGINEKQSMANVVVSWLGWTARVAQATFIFFCFL